MRRDLWAWVTSLSPPTLALYIQAVIASELKHLSYSSGYISACMRLYIQALIASETCGNVAWFSGGLLSLPA